MKRVVVNDKYTYETDLPVGVGDIVDLPGGIGGPGSHWTGEVTSLESQYTGKCLRINHIVESVAIKENDKTVADVLRQQSEDVAAAIEEIVQETKKYGPVTLAALLASAGRLLAAAKRAQITHRVDPQRYCTCGGSSLVGCPVHGESKA